VKEYGFTPELVGILNSQLSQNMLKAYDEGRTHGIDIGVTTERERIIKLLEEARDKCACYREVGMPVCRHQLSVDEQIALIKGENK
jgi:hypothetical protein